MTAIVPPLSYIAIEGVIGAGKTSFAKKLSEKINGRLVLEEFEENPFLSRFYDDKKRYAFQTQMFFLIDRFKQQEDIFEENLFLDYTVSDYIFEKDSIFASLNLTRDEMKLYKSIFAALKRSIRKPDLVVYLQSSVDRIMSNIEKRSRPYERNMSRQYIEELSEIYDNFFFSYKDTSVLMVNTTEMDFMNKEEEFEDLFNIIFSNKRAYVEYYQPEPRRVL